MWQVLAQRSLTAAGAGLLIGKMVGVLFRQLRINRPSQHASGLMSELFDLSKGRFQRRPFFAKAMLGQQRHQFIELGPRLGGQLQIPILSFLAHHRFLSKAATFPNQPQNLTATTKIHQPKNKPQCKHPKPVPAPCVASPPEPAGLARNVNLD